MKKLFALGAAMTLFAVGAIGCQNTAEGAKQDTANNTAAVKEAGDKAAVATERAATETAAATKAAADRAASATEKATDRAVSATEKATDRMAAATKNAGDALSLTPKVKLALTNDSELNNTANLIDVDSKNDKVVLNGHVMTAEMKTRAEHVAKQAVQAAGSSDQVVNELSINGKGKQE
jgi:osmotically-inducible protein OsmY